MLHATVDDMEYARRRNVNADELAALPIPYDPDKLPQRLGIEIKVDGIGLIDVNGMIQTLEGVPFEAALHLAHELGAIRQAFGTEMMLHGEFFEPGGFNATLSSFQAGKSTAGAVALWDAITLKAWHGHEQSPPLHQRRMLLSAAFLAVRPRMVVLNAMVPAPESADDWVTAALSLAVDDGNEGLVIKDLDSPYQRGRAPFWMKVKPDVTVDVPIQSFRLNADGRLRSLVVTFEGKPVVVGTGFSELLRSTVAEFWAGRMVEIRHVGRTDSGALRGVSFVRFRDDKGARA